MGFQIFLSVVSSVRGDTWLYEYPSVTVLQTICRSLLIRKIDLFSVMKCFRRNEIMIFPWWIYFWRNEIQNPSWNAFFPRHGFLFFRDEFKFPWWIQISVMNHFTTAWKPLFSVMKFYTLRNDFTPSVMSPIVCSVMKYIFPSWNFRPWWITFPVMNTLYFRHEILFFPSWIGLCFHYSILSSHHELAAGFKGLAQIHSPSSASESTDTTRRRTGIVIVYSVLITNGIPSCTPHRHTRERSSNR